MESQVTGKDGRYQFLVDEPGIYEIKVTKNEFDFPSLYLANKRKDGEYSEVYHGEKIEVSEEDATIRADIPLDPDEETREPSRIIWKRRLRKAQSIAAFGGVALAVVIAVLQPGIITYVMVGVQLSVYFLFRRLASPRKPKDWGVVYDTKTGKPLSNVVVRLFEPEYNRLLDTAVTDEKGRYNFMLGPDKYYAVFEKPGYEAKEVRPIDYEDREGADEFAPDLELAPA